MKSRIILALLCLLALTTAVQAQVLGGPVVEGGGGGGNSGSAAAFVPTGSSVPTDGLYLPSANTSGIADRSLPVVQFTNPASATDYLTLSGSATATYPLFPGVTFAAAGSDTDINILENSKGLGEVVPSGNQNYIFNVNSNSLPYTRACFDKVINQSANCIMLGVGTSLTFGLKANPVSDKAQNWMYQMAGAFNKMGMPTSIQNWFGTAYSGANSMLEDGRLSVGADWSQSATYASIGGYMITATSGGTHPIAFTPGYIDSSGTLHKTPVDTCIIYYPKYTGLGSFSYNVDGGAPTTINENASDAWGSTTVSMTLGTHTLNVNWASGSAFLVGELCYNSAYKQIFMLNAGGPSALTSAMNSVIQTGKNDPWAPGNAIAQLTPDVTFIEAGGNEMLNSVSTSTFLTNLQSLVTLSYWGSGDVILLSYDHVATSYASEAVQKSYIEEIATAANATSPPTPFIDLFTRFVSYAQENTLGFKYSGDQVHDLAKGYHEWVEGILGGLMPIMPQVGGNAQAGDAIPYATVLEGLYSMGSTINMIGTSGSLTTAAVAINPYDINSSNECLSFNAGRYLICMDATDGNGNITTGGSKGWTLYVGGTNGQGVTGTQAIAVSSAGVVQFPVAGVKIGATNTPADNAACTAGTFWWDTGFIYVCTASGTVKRATLSTY